MIINELKEKLKQMDMEILKTDNTLFIIHDGKKVAHVLDDRFCAFTIKENAKILHDWARVELINLLVRYSQTPPADREEKKYMYKLPNEFECYYLAYDFIKDNYYFTGVDEPFKNQSFTNVFNSICNLPKLAKHLEKIEVE